MKLHMYLAFFVLITTSSCRMWDLPETRTPSGPYVQLRSGKKIEGSSAERERSFFVNDKITVGDTTVKSKDVSFYSTGDKTYANVGRRTFAPQVASGKINLYKYEYTSTSYDHYANGVTRVSHNRHISYYIQNGSGSPIKPLCYKYLAPMVKPNTPEFEMFQKYRRTRTIGRVLGFGSIGLIGGGAAMAKSSNSGTASLGTSIEGVGVAALIGWAVMSLPNSIRLLKTVLVADKAQKGKHNGE